MNGESFEFTDHQLDIFNKCLKYKENSDIQEAYFANKNIIDNIHSIFQRSNFPNNNLSDNNLKIIFKNMNVIINNMALRSNIVNKNGLESFNDSLRTLYSPDINLVERINQFIDLHGVGIVTASHFLFVYDLETYPFYSIPVNEALKITPIQKNILNKIMMSKYNIVDSYQYNKRTFNYIREQLFYEKIKYELNLSDYLLINHIFWKYYLLNIKYSEKVAWGQKYRGGGYLEDYLKNMIQNMIDQFATLLESESNKEGINKFVFPLYRNFNFISAVTHEKILCAFSPSMNNIPIRSWLDWREKLDFPSSIEFKELIQRDTDWNPIYILELPYQIINFNYKDRSRILHNNAKNWVQEALIKIKPIRISKIDPIFKGKNIAIDEELCLILIPEDIKNTPIYNNYIKSTVLESGLTPLTVSDIIKNNNIMDSIWEYINKSNIIIADITGKNSNIYFELGLTLSIGKPTIILTQNIEDVIFDINDISVIEYNVNKDGLKKLKKDLEDELLIILNKISTNKYAVWRTI